MHRKHLRSAVEFSEFEKYMNKARDRVKGRPFTTAGRIRQRGGVGSPITISYNKRPLVAINPDDTLELLVTGRQLFREAGNAAAFLRRELGMNIIHCKGFKGYYNVVSHNGMHTAWWFKGLRLTLGAHKPLNPRRAPKLVPDKDKDAEWKETVRVGASALVAQLRIGAMREQFSKAYAQPRWHRYVGAPAKQVDILYTALVSASEGLPISDAFAGLIVREIRSWYADPQLESNHVQALKTLLKRRSQRLRMKAGARVWDTPYNPFDGD